MPSLDDVLANRRWGFACKRIVTALELLLLSYYKRNPLEKAALDVIRKVYARQTSLFSILFFGATPVLFSPGELLNLYHTARLMRDHGGAYAEVGAFKGDSAEIVCGVKEDRPFYVFEAFEGLPSGGHADRRFAHGMFASSEANLRRRLNQYPNTIVVPGYFPRTASAILTETFSYVHLDVDLYATTRAALEFFYPRMRAGGRIISHDYGQCEGVWRAVNEFLADRPEQAEPMGASQVLIVKS